MWRVGGLVAAARSWALVCCAVARRCFAIQGSRASQTCSRLSSSSSAPLKLPCRVSSSTPATSISVGPGSRSAHRPRRVQDDATRQVAGQGRPRRRLLSLALVRASRGRGADYSSAGGLRNGRCPSTAADCEFDDGSVGSERVVDVEVDVVNDLGRPVVVALGRLINQTLNGLWAQ